MIRISRHESDTGSFEHIEREPSPRLSGIVRRYSGYSSRSRRPRCMLETAQDSVALIVNFGPPIRVGGAERATVEVKSFVAPLLDTYAVTEMPTEARGLQVDLSPLGAYMLFGVAMHELSDVVVPLAGLFGSAADLLVEQLFEAADWETRFDLLEAFIAARVEQTHQPSPDVAWAWRRLSETSGRLPIGRLAEELGCSRRHLAARFREHVGPSPKTAARIMRFKRAAELLAADDGTRFAEIAQTCGYYDQPHLNRDFRELAGRTPRAYVAATLPGGFGVLA